MKLHKRKLILLTALLAVPLGLLWLSHRFLDQFRGLQPGDMLPKAEVQSADGSSFDTLLWRGKPTLLVLFEPSCQACQAEIRTLTAVAPSFPKANVVLLSLDSQDEVTRGSTPFPVYFDPSGEFLKVTRKLAVPLVYGISSEGRIEYWRTGEHSEAEEQDLFRRLLQTGD